MENEIFPETVLTGQHIRANYSGDRPSDIKEPWSCSSTLKVQFSVLKFAGRDDKDRHVDVGRKKTQDSQIRTR
jgi:hypothetical protein